MDELPTCWDNSPTIRERVRDGMNLLVCLIDGKLVNGDVSSARENLGPNQAVLSPVAVLMRKNSLQLPSIDRLIEAIFCFFATARQARSREHCYKESWAIRRLIGRLKTYAYKEHPPQDHGVRI